MVVDRGCGTIESNTVVVNLEQMTQDIECDRSNESSCHSIVPNTVLNISLSQATIRVFMTCEEFYTSLERANCSYSRYSAN